MISFLEIRNFKSIRHLRLDCRRVNVFIGEPNTGKSNILESLGLLSFLFFGLPFANIQADIQNFVRLRNITDLLYEHHTDEDVEIRTDEDVCTIRYDEEGNRFRVESTRCTILADPNFQSIGYTLRESDSTSPFKFYRFSPVHTFREANIPYLLPPRGENLPYVLMRHKDLLRFVRELFEPFDWRLVINPQEGRLELWREIDEGIVSALPYTLVSDTLQRLIFHITAVETNRDSVLIFEEPEAHAFPFHTKFLAEEIGLDESNQYFISTHNPFFLLPLLEKTKVDDIAVFIVYYRHRQTLARPMVGQEVERLLELGRDVFFNLDLFLEGEEG